LAARPREFQQSPEALYIVVCLLKLIVISGISDGSEMKNRVELFLAELFPPVQLRQIDRTKGSAITRQILETSGAKIVDHGESRIRKSLLQFQNKIRPDKAGATGHK